MAKTRKQPSQVAKFREVARSLGAEKSASQFDKTLKRVAKAKPPAPKKKPKRAR